MNLEYVLLAVANVDGAVNNKNGTTQKSIMFQEVFLKIGFGQGSVF